MTLDSYHNKHVSMQKKGQLAKVRVRSQTILTNIDHLPWHLWQNSFTVIKGNSVFGEWNGHLISKAFFLKLHCPKNEQNIWQNFALAS